VAYSGIVPIKVKRRKRKKSLKNEATKEEQEEEPGPGGVGMGMGTQGQEEGPRTGDVLVASGDEGGTAIIATNWTADSSTARRVGMVLHGGPWEPIPDTAEDAEGAQGAAEWQLVTSVVVGPAESSSYRRGGGGGGLMALLCHALRAVAFLSLLVMIIAGLSTKILKDDALSRREEGTADGAGAAGSSLDVPTPSPAASGTTEQGQDGDGDGSGNSELPPDELCALELHATYFSERAGDWWLKPMGETEASKAPSARSVPPAGYTHFDPICWESLVQRVLADVAVRSDTWLGPPAALVANVGDAYASECVACATREGTHLASIAPTQCSQDKLYKQCKAEVLPLVLELGTCAAAARSQGYVLGHDGSSSSSGSGGPQDAAGPERQEECVEPSSEADCRTAAQAAGYTLGSSDWPFAGRYESNSGCYTYSSGSLAGSAYWSTALTPLSGNRVRVCMPPSSSAAAGGGAANANADVHAKGRGAQQAESMGAAGVGSGWNFYGNYSAAGGCVVYNDPAPPSLEDNPYAGSVFYSFNPSVDARMTKQLDDDAGVSVAGTAAGGASSSQQRLGIGIGMGMGMERLTREKALATLPPSSIEDDDSSVAAANASARGIGMHWRWGTLLSQWRRRRQRERAVRLEVEVEVAVAVAVLAAAGGRV
jgi:hypothetical protein